VREHDDRRALFALRFTTKHLDSSIAEKKIAR